METESKPFDTLLVELILRWRDDSGGTYRNWFLWEERIKNFRSIRRGISQVVAEIDAGDDFAAAVGAVLDALGRGGNVTEEFVRARRVLGGVVRTDAGAWSRGMSR